MSVPRVCDQLPPSRVDFGPTPHIPDPPVIPPASPIPAFGERAHTPDTVQLAEPHTDDMRQLVADLARAKALYQAG